jgi:hypothetical protein
MKPCPFKKYFCAITGGFDPNGFNYPQDIYIEWHWATQYNVPTTVTYINGKFIFVATYAHILAQYNANGGGWLSPPGNPGQFGIPLFNPSNHNP